MPPNEDNEDSNNNREERNQFPTNILTAVMAGMVKGSYKSSVNDDIVNSWNSQEFDSEISSHSLGTCERCGFAHSP